MHCQLSIFLHVSGDGMLMTLIPFSLETLSTNTSTASTRTSSLRWRRTQIGNSLYGHPLDKGGRRIYLNFESHHLAVHKRAVVKTLLHRAEALSSSVVSRVEKKHMTKALQSGHAMPQILPALLMDAISLTPMWRLKGMRALSPSSLLCVYCLTAITVQEDRYNPAGS